jgi:hypothetical protein
VRSGWFAPTWRALLAVLVVDGAHGAALQRNPEHPSLSRGGRGWIRWRVALWVPGRTLLAALVVELLGGCGAPPPSAPPSSDVFSGSYAVTFGAPADAACPDLSKGDLVMAFDVDASGRELAPAMGPTGTSETGAAWFDEDSSSARVSFASTSSCAVYAFSLTFDGAGFRGDETWSGACVHPCVYPVTGARR